MPIPIRPGRQLSLPVESLNNRTEVGEDKEEQFRSNIMKPKKNKKSQLITTAFYK